MHSTPRELEPSRPRWWAGLLLVGVVVSYEVLVALLLSRGGVARERVHDSWAGVLYDLACGLGTIALVFAALRLGKKPVRSNLYLAPAAWGEVLLVVVVVLALGPWRGLIANLVDPASGSSSSHDPTPWTAPILVLFALRGLLVPVAEELLFRGYVLSAFRSRSTILAIVVSALLFAAIHLELRPLWFLVHLPFGLVSAYCVIRLGTIVPVIVAHAVWNLLAGLHLAPSRWFEPELLPLAASAVILAGGLFVLTRSTRSMMGAG